MDVSSLPLALSHTIRLPVLSCVTNLLLPTVAWTTLCVWPVRVISDWPLDASHTRAVWSALVLTRRDPSAFQVTDVTAAVCLFRVLSNAPVPPSHRRTVSSVPAVAILLPSGLHAACTILPV